MGDDRRQYTGGSGMSLEGRALDLAKLGAEVINGSSVRVADGMHQREESFWGCDLDDG